MYDLHKIKHLESLLDKKPIMELVEEFEIDLDEKGRCSCLLHEETRPSMFIDFIKNKWHCFSCQHGGGPSKLIGDYYQSNYGTKNYFEALARYLDKHIELREELGFIDLTDRSGQSSPISLKKVLEKCDQLGFQNHNISRIKIIEKPKLNADIQEIMSYVTRLQREGK